MGGLHEPDGGGGDGELRRCCAPGEGERRRGILCQERKGDRAERHLLRAGDGVTQEMVCRGMLPATIGYRGGQATDGDRRAREPPKEDMSGRHR